MDDMDVVECDCDDCVEARRFLESHQKIINGEVEE
jgi:hypothetical protein